MAPKLRGDGSGDGPPPKTTKRDTSFKLDMLDALLLNSLIKPADFVVAFAIIQHRNSENGECYPGMDRIADITGFSTRYVQKCVNKLRRVKWLTSRRPNRQNSNRYEFDETFAHVHLRHKKRILKEREARRLSAETNGSSRQSQPQTGTIDRPARRTVAPPNTLIEHLKRDAG